MYDVNVLIKYGIDIKKCEELFGNMDVYNESLKDFVDNINMRITTVSNFLVNGQIKNYVTEVHAINSDARYLGFGNLVKVASDLESACIHHDINLINTYHMQLLEQVKYYVSVSKLYFGLSPSQELDDNVNTVLNHPVVENNTSNQDASTNVNIIDEEMEPTVKIKLINQKESLPVVKPKLVKDKILIADDSSLTTKLVHKFLSNDYDVVTVANGKEVIQLLDNPEFRKTLKLCLLDLNMPNVDGYQVLEHCRRNNYFKEIPIAIESGVEDTVSLDRVNIYPIVGILLKPFKEADLRRIVEKSQATYF